MTEKQLEERLYELKRQIAAAEKEFAEVRRLLAERRVLDSLPTDVVASRCPVDACRSALRLMTSTTERVGSMPYYDRARVAGFTGGRVEATARYLCAAGHEFEISTPR